MRPRHPREAAERFDPGNLSRWATTGMAISSLQTLFLDLVNASRAQAGLKPLAFDAELVDAANKHSAWMVARDVFSHTGAGGSSAGDRIKAAGYDATGWGENIAYIGGPGQAVLDEADVRQLHTNLMNSAPHRANLLNPGFTEIGIGLAQGDFGGSPVVMVTETFGTPTAAEAAEADGPPPAPTPTPTPAPPPSPATVAVGSGPDTVSLRVSEDAWRGDARFTVAVDGKQIGGILTATASHALGHTQEVHVRGAFGPGAHTVRMTFLNDAWGGTAATDRNLYLDGLSYNGVDAKQAAALLRNGFRDFSIPASAPLAAPAETSRAAASVTPAQQDTVSSLFQTDV